MLRNTSFQQPFREFLASENHGQSWLSKVTTWLHVANECLPDSLQPIAASNFLYDFFDWFPKNRGFSINSLWKTLLDSTVLLFYNIATEICSLCVRICFYCFACVFLMYQLIFVTCSLQRSSQPGEFFVQTRILTPRQIWNNQNLVSTDKLIKYFKLWGYFWGAEQNLQNWN